MKDLLKVDSNATEPAAATPPTPASPAAHPTAPTPPTAPTAPTLPTAIKSIAVKPGKINDEFLYGEQLLKHHNEKEDHHESSPWKNLESKGHPENDANDKEKLLRQMREQMELDAKVIPNTSTRPLYSFFM